MDTQPNLPDLSQAFKQSTTEQLTEQIEALKPASGAVLQIVQWPDPTLRIVSKPVVSGIKDDKPLQELLDDMVHTMQAYGAVGLAAIQVGVPLRVLVVQDQTRKPVKVINPVIKEVDGHSFQQEGCLSFPGLFVAIKRPAEVVVEFYDENGDMKTTVATDLLGRAILHEIDHLDGKVFLDLVSKLNKAKVMKDYERIQKKINRRNGGTSTTPTKKKR